MWIRQMHRNGNFYSLILKEVYYPKIIGAGAPTKNRHVLNIDNVRQTAKTKVVLKNIAVGG